MKNSFLKTIPKMLSLACTNRSDCLIYKWRAWRRGGCPAARASHKLTGENVCVSSKECVHVCWLISGGQGSAEAVAVGQKERGQFFSLPPREKSAGGEGNEPETGWEQSSWGGTRTGRHTPSLTSHIHPSLSLSPYAATLLWEAKHHQGSVFFFSLHRFTHIPHFCSAWLCLFCSRSHTNLKNTFVCASMHTVTG